MLISYRIISGPAISVCVKTSGGVNTAAPMKITTREYFLFVRNQVAFSIPSLVKMNEIVGSSKTSPNANKRWIVRDR